MMDFKKTKLMLVNSETEDAIYLPIRDYSITADPNGTTISINSELLCGFDNKRVESVLKALRFSL